MTVRDYEHDMINGQKFAIQVETEETIDTIHYSVPVLCRCPYYDDTVQYFRVIDNEIILVVSRKEFV